MSKNNFSKLDPISAILVRYIYQEACFTNRSLFSREEINIIFDDLINELGFSENNNFQKTITRLTKKNILVKNGDQYSTNTFIEKLNPKENDEWKFKYLPRYKRIFMLSDSKRFHLSEIGETTPLKSILSFTLKFHEPAVPSLLISFVWNLPQPQTNLIKQWSPEAKKGIYFLLSTKNQRDTLYIGQTQNIQDRLLQHISNLSKEEAEFKWCLFFAIKEFTPKNHILEIVETLTINFTEETFLVSNERSQAKTPDEDDLLIAYQLAEAICAAFLIVERKFKLCIPRKQIK